MKIIDLETRNLVNKNRCLYEGKIIGKHGCNNYGAYTILNRYSYEVKGVYRNNFIENIKFELDHCYLFEYCLIKQKLKIFKDLGYVKLEDSILERVYQTCRFNQTKYDLLFTRDLNL